MVCWKFFFFSRLWVRLIFFLEKCLWVLLNLVNSFCFLLENFSFLSLLSSVLIFWWFFKVVLICVFIGCLCSLVLGLFGLCCKLSMIWEWLLESSVIIWLVVFEGISFLLYKVVNCLLVLVMLWMFSILISVISVRMMVMVIYSCVFSESECLLDFGRLFFCFVVV